jgi:Flp pilus assembly protein TadG
MNRPPDFRGADFSLQPRHSCRGSQRGSTLVEFALCAIFLVPILAGTFTIGLALVKAIQVRMVCRNANVLVVRGINLAAADKQRLIVKAAAGLRMNIPGTWNPDPNGKGVIILSRVLRVGDSECLAAGLQPNAGNCPNWGSYVITNRITFGNASQLTSTVGTPFSARDANGDISLNDYVTDTANRASGFPGILALEMGSFVYISEASFDVSELNLFNLIAPDIYARNLS